MGSGVWYKNIISKRKVKGEKSRRVKRSSFQRIDGCREDLCSLRGCLALANGACLDNQGSVVLSREYVAARKIQTAYRAHVARRSLCRMRGNVRLQKLVQCDSVKNQAHTTLGRLHSWTKTQAQIRSRRANMVMEGQLRQKKLENQLKLEAKLHDFEVEWSGGSETVTEALARIHHREEAALRRERALAYAFTRQWRANTMPSFGPSNKELSKADWGWSWMERWIAARPWESRVYIPKKAKKARHAKLILPNGKAVKKTISPASKVPGKVTRISPNGKATRKARKLSYNAATVKKVSVKSEEKKTKNAKESSQV
ncbi:protein IQ-DOMAIN 5-like [Salvia splendens]|uniref:protein IQ-DOMAIN 5-like n=1 Tax=Salvia splendens TaxID=180675 RepID=UPI001C25E0CF|nr:protein IQ-DOMAIN 5-like [Salvia splendens]XP_042029491.1 protein IQ-DOMAIN 5-like [Salvia splendens]XP_042029492.1 protein IQ-DOMAIN 5-like [Salvia splendens]